MKLEIPLRLPSMANQRLHWAVKAKQTKAQRSAVALAWRSFENANLRASNGRWSNVPRAPARILLTRVAPRELDDDNIRAAFKGIRDEVAKQYGFDDSRKSPLVWEYAQAKGKPKEYAVRIEIKSLAGCPGCQSGSLDHPDDCKHECHAPRVE